MKKHPRCPYCDSVNSQFSQHEVVDGSLKYSGFEFECNGCGETFGNNYSIQLTTNSRVEAERLIMAD